MSFGAIKSCSPDNNNTGVERFFAMASFAINATRASMSREARRGEFRILDAATQNKSVQLDIIKSARKLFAAWFGDVRDSGRIRVIRTPRPKAGTE